MAKLFPKIDPDEIDNPGERMVARSLIEQLPGRVEVFHGFNWLARSSRGTLLEGECDFILLEPEKGLLFVEVKGGSLLFDGEKWVRKVRAQRRELNKDPFEQAQRAMHDIVDIVTRRYPSMSNGLPFTYGFAVAFPDCRVSGWLPPSIQRELILDAAMLRSLPDGLRRIFASFARSDHRALYPDEVMSVREALYPKYQLVPVLWRKIEDQEERLRRLTDDQQRILDTLAQQPKAAISGVAGSGKTLLAIAKAQAMAREGYRTLLICYNHPLKDWLCDAVADAFGGNLVIDNYHGLAYDLCRTAGVPWNQGNTHDPEFWSEVVPAALEEACEKLGPEHKFDAIVVDEGQDFQVLWWESLQSVFRDADKKACYYVFYDPNQNLFVDNPSLPDELGPTYLLPTNCRNTVRIAAHCASLVGHENQVRDDAPLGEEPAMVSVGTLREAVRTAGRQIREMCLSNAGGLKPSQVAVLAPASVDELWPDRVATIPLTRDFDEWRRGEGVLIATWGRFKGLEADAVVIIETPMGNEARETTSRYVARSRAKHLLTVIEVGS